MKTKLFFLTILFSFSFSNVKAQCPSGDVQLLSQAQVDNFVLTYPNCEHITGNLLFGEFGGGPTNDISDISGFENLIKIDGVLGVYSTELTSLNGMNNLNQLGGLKISLNYNLESIAEMINLTELSNNQLEIAINENLHSLQGLNNIQSISGRLYLLDNDSLSSLEGLNSLTSVGGRLSINDTHLTTLEGLNNLTTVSEWVVIGYNPLLTSIEALQNLTFVKDGLTIAYNPQLTSLNGIQNINSHSEWLGIGFSNNENLSSCNYPNICEYLSWNSTEYPREIFENTGNCTDEQAVLAACGLGINDVENGSTNWNVVYQKNTGSFLIQSSGFQMAEIEVYDLSGKLIKSIENLNSNREELRVFTPENILIIKVKSQEGKSFAKKAMMK